MANLFDIVVAKALAGGGGGSSITVEPLSVTENDTYTAPTGKAYSPVTVNVSGGSSAFSTAEVTVILGGEMYEASLIGLPHIDSNSLRDVDLITGDEGERIVLSVPLYKGVLVTLCVGGVYAESVTGGIVMDSETGMLTITGDGTITINANW